MIIDKLTLHNFGIYGGRPEIELTPTSSKKPIVLFGGLNGGGKTTFLDALMLVLYGKFAKCSNRGNLGYDEFLRKSINRHVNEKDGASIELAFRHRQSNVEESIRITRSWRATGKGIREDVNVFRNDQFDPSAGMSLSRSSFRHELPTCFSLMAKRSKISPLRSTLRAS